MNDIRPCLITVGELFGGVERHVMSLAQWLTERGASPTLIVFHDRALAEGARAKGIPLEVLAGSSAAAASVPRRIAAVLRRERSSVVHVHGYRATVMGYLATRSQPVGMVRTVHGLREAGARPSWAGLKSQVYGGLERTAARLARTYDCFVTDELQRLSEPAGPGARSRVIPNGIEAPVVEGRPRPDSFGAGGFHIVAIGRLTRVKGLEYAIDAVAGVAPALDAHLHLVGVGEEQDALRAQAAARGVAARVHFEGFRTNVEDYLAHADCLVMPSRHEGMPYTILEAMGAGCPIVASDVGGLKEVIENGRTGLLVPVGDIVAIGRAWTKLAGSAEYARSIAREAAARQRERYSLEQMGRAYWEVYRAATV